MIISKSLYVVNRKDWRAWLSKNWNKEKEIWLIYYKKNSGKERIPYNDAVEEALCFGWIDSTAKTFNKDSFVQRFSPRRKGSNISQTNTERVRKMIKQKKMTKAGLDAIAHAFNPNKHTIPSKLKIAPDILKALKYNKEAWINFQNFSPQYQRIRISYIEHYRSRSEDEFNKKLNYFIKMTSKNKKFGQVQ